MTKQLCITCIMWSEEAAEPHWPRGRGICFAATETPEPLLGFELWREEPVGSHQYKLAGKVENGERLAEYQVGMVTPFDFSCASWQPRESVVRQPKG